MEDVKSIFLEVTRLKRFNDTFQGHLWGKADIRNEIECSLLNVLSLLRPPKLECMPSVARVLVGLNSKGPQSDVGENAERLKK